VRVAFNLVREDVYERLKQRIVDGTLPPGELLKDKAIALSLGVSRTPVREAVRRLDDEGLVETASNRWTRVAPLDVTNALESYAVIEALETLALRLAWPRLTRDDARRLVVANKTMLDATRRHDALGALRADEAFHDLWIRTSDNGELQRLAAQVKLRLRRVELVYFDAVGLAEQSYREHRRIVKAIAERSHVRAAAALRGNWRESAGRLRACTRASRTVQSTAGTQVALDRSFA
jgi:DNA-binding GntR family transcriptional regulator